MDSSSAEPDTAGNNLRPPRQQPRAERLPDAQQDGLGRVAALTYEKVSIIARARAALIDIAVAYVAYIPVMAAASLAGSPYEVFASPLILVVILCLAYLVGRDSIGGAGIGKAMMGLVVVSAATGAPVGGVPAAVRQLVLLAASMVPGVGIIVETVLAATDAQGRRLGDRVAGTRVVYTAEAVGRVTLILQSGSASWWSVLALRWCGFSSGRWREPVL